MALIEQLSPGPAPVILPEVDERARRWGGWGRCQTRAGVEARADELALEAPDLVAQGAARGALVDLREDDRRGAGRELLDQCHV